MDHLIQSNSARETIMASTCETRNQNEPLFSGAAWACRFQMVAPLTTSGYSPNMMTWATRTSYQIPSTPQPADMDNDNGTVFLNRNRRAEYSQKSDLIEEYEKIIHTITTLFNRLQTTNTIRKLLHIHVPTFRRNKNRFNEFEQLPRNHIRPFSNRLTEEVKLQSLESLLRKETMEIFQSLTMKQLRQE